MKKILNLVVLAAMLTACDVEGFFEKRSEPVDAEETLSHDMIVLGRQLEDPYSVTNISKALQSLYPTRAGDVDVRTTHLYVRFLPESDEQYEKLEGMGLELIDHPVDYEIVKDGDYYHDPLVPEDDITWQYAVVDPDFEFPRDVRYEILDRCHITEHDVVSRASDDGIDWLAVEEESFRLTGNAALLCDRTVTRGGSNKPSGRITIEDERLEGMVEGVKGVRVACNVFVKIGQAYTDDQGYYSIGKSFSSKPRYWLVFKNKKGFGIGLNLILVGGSMSTLGKHSSAGCDKHITAKSDRGLFSRCVVNNAVWDYFEGCKTDKLSMKAPPSNIRIWIFRNLSSSSAVMMQHGAGIDNTKVGKLLGEYSSIIKWFLPDITLGIKDRYDYASIYAATVHELAHASHFQQVGKAWWDKLMENVMTSFVTAGMTAYGTGGETYAGYCEVAEMWAYYMETKLYRNRYPGSSASFGTSWWFYPQIFYYLDEMGLGRYKIFQALTTSVTDRDSLRESLLSLYPEFKTNIMLAFNRYY